MKPINLEHWEPYAEDPRRMVCTGQRTASEVFYELEYRLKSLGLLPDEYFQLAPHWDKARLIPRNADIYCVTDYGESEGIYIDVYIFWMEDETRKEERFITGKTLESTGKAMDRMFLISSVITKAFHGDQGSYSRYVSMDSSESESDMILALNEKEQQALLDALTETWSRKMNELDGMEGLIRRMTGNITAYMNLMGRRPLHMSAFDRAMLAIRDGEFETFEEYWPQAKDHADDLLIEAAARPGMIGRKMTDSLLNGTLRFSSDAWLDASVKALHTGDLPRVLKLMDKAEELVDNLPLEYYGKVIEHAAGRFRNMGVPMVEHCTAEQIAAVPPFTLQRAATDSNSLLLEALVKKGAATTGYGARILTAIYVDIGNWYVEHILKQGMQISSTEYDALQVCIQNHDSKSARILLNRGMDFSKCKAWMERNRKMPEDTSLMEKLERYAETLKSK